MKNDNLDQLLKGVEVPEPNELTRARIKRDAMAAFISESTQGNTEAARLTETTSVVNRNKRGVFMKKATMRQVWAGSLAASIAMVVVWVVFKQIPTEEINAIRPDVAVNQPLMMEPVEKPKDERGVSANKTAVRPAEKVAQLKSDLPSKNKRNSEADQYHADAAGVSAESVEGGSASADGVAVYDQSIATGTMMSAAPASVAVPRAKMEASLVRIVAKESSAVIIEESNRDRFSHQDEGAVKRVKEQPVSTLSIDVDTASYSFVRRQLNRGALPAQDAVRVEEMINYFDYHYPTPASKKEPFATHVHVINSPWNQGNKLVHIGIKGYEIIKEKQPDSNLVFLLDVSGSMNSPDKLPLVKQSMSLLLESLKPNDTVAIVVYAGAAGAVLEPTKVKDKNKILAALEQLEAGGSTAGAQGLELAYQLAERNFNKQAVNRIILATDGDFNVGITQDERLEDFVARKRKTGIYLSVFGFGEGNYQDALMQTLAQNGNGIAAYIDTLGEAQKILIDEATSALFPIANDVKIQIEFNPETVAEYRLIGYETRTLNREDFNNDKVDAGDIGAGHTVTAIYEITPASSSDKLIDPSRYQKEEKTKIISDELAFLKLSYKRPGESKSNLHSIPIAEVKDDRKLTAAEIKLIDEVNFSVSVAGFAQILRGSDYTGEWSYDDVIALAQKSKGDDAYGYRTEFIQLVRKAKIAKAM